jgi:hypothetical protein
MAHHGKLITADPCWIDTFCVSAPCHVDSTSGSVVVHHPLKDLISCVFSRDFIQRSGVSWNQPRFHGNHFNQHSHYYRRPSEDAKPQGYPSPHAPHP